MVDGVIYLIDFRLDWGLWDRKCVVGYVFIDWNFRRKLLSVICEVWIEGRGLVDEEDLCYFCSCDVMFIVVWWYW